MPSNNSVYLYQITYVPSWFIKVNIQVSERYGPNFMYEFQFLFLGHFEKLNFVFSHFIDNNLHFIPGQEKRKRINERLH